MPKPIFVDDTGSNDGTPLNALWFNQISDAIWDAIGDGNNPPVNPAQVKTNLSLDALTNDAQLTRTAADWGGFPDGGPGFASGDKLLIEDALGGTKQTIDFDDIVALASGEANTTLSVGVNGVGLTLAKVGALLPFKSIAPASAKIAIVNDVINDDVTIDVVEGNIAHDNIILPASDAHPADAITNVPAGNIAAIEVQAAIDELETEKVGAAFTSNLTAGYTMPLFDLGTNGTVTPDNTLRNRFSWIVTGAAILNAPGGNADMTILLTGTGGSIDVSAYDHIIGSYDNTKDAVIGIWSEPGGSHFIAFGTPAA